MCFTIILNILTTTLDIVTTITIITTTGFRGDVSDDGGGDGCQELLADQRRLRGGTVHGFPARAD
jgi:hypothetical protein